MNTVMCNARQCSVAELENGKMLKLPAVWYLSTVVYCSTSDISVSVNATMSLCGIIVISHHKFLTLIETSETIIICLNESIMLLHITV